MRVEMNDRIKRYIHFCTEKCVEMNGRIKRHGLNVNIPRASARTTSVVSSIRIESILRARLRVRRLITARKRA